jgi:hypothetical protein
MATGKSEDDLFKSITESAFEFLRTAIGEFSTSPKFSTIHFATAAELFLKARLMREHWSLVAEDVGRAKRNSFLAGQLRTVSTSAAIARLRELAGITISAEAEETFKKIADHRNKMIHFIHEDDNPEQNQNKLLKQANLEKVAKEQCQGWLALERLLIEWIEHFEPWRGQIFHVRALMKGHHDFLSAVFERVATEIDDAKKTGARFQTCPSCTFEAAQVDALEGCIYEMDCRVCGHTDTLIAMACPTHGCTESLEFVPNKGFPKCQLTNDVIDSSEVWDALDTDSADPIDYTARNCGQCLGYHSVIRHHNVYFCTECFYAGHDYGVCGWCSEGQLGGGDMEGSFYNGCEFCDGRAGWDTDD